MQLVAQQAGVQNGSSLLFDWLNKDTARDTPQRDFPSSDAGSEVPRIVDGDSELCDFRDESRDVDM